MHAWIDLTVGSNLKNWNHNNDLKVLEINERERETVCGLSRGHDECITSTW